MNIQDSFMLKKNHELQTRTSQEELENRHMVTFSPPGLEPTATKIVEQCARNTWNIGSDDRASPEPDPIEP
ncbi:hypothetical protein TCAL_15762 [Tigriopus californicus]|uniref:Uncharacterized protein n=1 Tax=Tigriopus californicus TaxID=6832 RepID=A0A553P791_TIGCA|nr:hypothetical protein TCAL_15762 [Tigriopus californicus]